MSGKRYSSRTAVALCWGQGSYFVVTAAWPILSVRTFQFVTGKKSDHLIAESPTEADHWMLFTISGLIISVSIVILAAAWRRWASADTALLGITSALCLSIIDVVYVTRGTIAPIYLADAALEAVIITAWGYVLWNGPSDPALHQ